MSDFPIFTLPSANLEKVISKVQPKSYFRLQQTCRGVMEFIQTSKNVTNNLDEFFNAQYVILNYDRNGLACIVMWSDEISISLDSLYGCRLNTLQAMDEGLSFESLCTILNRYRITVNQITGYPNDWTGEQAIKLARLLKPNYMNLCSLGCQVYKDAAKLKSLKQIVLSLEPFNVVDAAATLIPHLTSIHITTLETIGQMLRLFTDQLLELLAHILTLIFSNQYPNLHHFQFDPDFEGNLSMDEIEEHFRGLDMTIKKIRKGDQTIFLLEKRQLRDRLYCSITCQNGGGRAHIIYDIFGNFIH